MIQREFEWDEREIGIKTVRTRVVSESVNRFLVSILKPLPLNT